ncbi:Eco57I restriction-modification methylase domain-containing protein, partial [Thiolapillus sp.]
VVSDAVCESVNELAEYDFDSEISVTVLGHIFEQSIADLEALSSRMDEGELPTPPKTKAVSGRRKRQGVVYTTDHITAFIVEHTLGAHIEEQFHRLLSGYGQFKKDGSIQWKRGSKTELRFWYAWQERLQQIKVVDPACGSGAFLVAAFDWLHGEYQRVNDKLAELTGQHSVLDLNKTILNDNLYGVDINHESIEISKLSLWLKTAEKGKSLTSLDDNLIAGNSLGLDESVPGGDFTWQTAFPGILAQGGFDVVLGNPPYVRQERFSEIKPWLEAHYAVYHGVADLYAYFFELGMKLLKPGGRLGYISSSTFFKTASGEPLRRFLLDNAVLENIVDFGDLQVFEGVTTYPAILTLNKGQDSTAPSTSILVLDNTLPDNLGQYFTQHHGRMNPAQLSHASWQLEDERLHALRQKLTRGYPTLKDVYGSPYRGVLTGLNAAFVIDNATRQQLLDADSKSADLLKPFLEGKDLKKWHAEPRGLWLIAIPKFWTRKAMNKGEGDLDESSAWAWFHNKYPALADWLAPFADRARKRTDKGEFWWELRACAYYDKFSGPKVFYPDITDASKFHLDTTGAFAANTCYFIPGGDDFIAGLLNSKAVWFFLTGISDSVRGGFYRMFAQNIMRIPIPEAASTQKESIAEIAQQCQALAEQRYQLQQNITRRIPDLCPPDREAKLTNKLKSWWELDFDTFQKEIKKAFKTSIPLAERNDWQDYLQSSRQQVAELARELSAREEALNRAVYAVFDLTPEEIGLLENGL